MLKWTEAAEAVLEEEAQIRGRTAGLTNQQLFEGICRRQLVQLVGNTPINSMNARLNKDIKDNPATPFVKPAQGVFALKRFFCPPSSPHAAAAATAGTPLADDTRAWLRASTQRRRASAPASAIVAARRGSTSSQLSLRSSDTEDTDSLASLDSPASGYGSAAPFVKTSGGTLHAGDMALLQAQLGRLAHHNRPRLTIRDLIHADNDTPPPTAPPSPAELALPAVFVHAEPAAAAAAALTLTLPAFRGLDFLALASRYVEMV